MNGLRVFAYRTPGQDVRKFTLRGLSGGLVRQVDEAWLADATFEVSEAGRLRSLREHRRTIHAGIVGTLLDLAPRGPRCEVVVLYDPSYAPYFFSEDDGPVLHASLVHLIRGKAYIPRKDRWL